MADSPAAGRAVQLAAALVALKVFAQVARMVGWSVAVLAFVSGWFQNTWVNR